MPNLHPPGRSTSFRSLALFACLLSAPLLAAAACSSTVNGSAPLPDTGAGGEGGQGTGGAGGGDASGGSDGSGGSTTTVNLSCSEGKLEVGTPSELETASNEDSFTTSCGAGSSPDAAFEWTAPSTNYYAFDSGGSDFDTVVSVLDGDCDGEELTCSNVAGASPQARAVTKLTKGQHVVVVLDGNLGESGHAALEVSPITCPTTDVSDQPLPATLTTVGGTNTHEGACQDANATGTPEKAVRYVPKADGLYRFSVTSSDFSPELYVEQGAECGGLLLQCNANVKGGHPAEVTRWLTAGSAVTLIVDGGSGSFTLDAQKLEDPGACAALPQLTNVTDAVIDDASPKLLSSSCVWAGNMGFDDKPHPYPEHAYTFTVDLAVAETFTVSIASEGSFNSYLLSGNKCDGAELQCHGEEQTRDYFFSKSDNGVYTLVIENTNSFGGPLTYSLTVSE